MTVHVRPTALSSKDQPATKQPAAKQPRRVPGWAEIGFGGLAYVLAFLVVARTLPLVDDPGTKGVLGLFVAGTMGLVATATAVLVRRRRLTAYGLGPASRRQLVVGGLLGLASYVLGTAVAIGYALLTGDAQNVQTSYQAAAAGGWPSLALVLVAGAVLTPLGEEAFFRGILANALLSRYRAWVGVVGSAAVFALAHGINPILPIAFVLGVLTALLFRWSGPSGRASSCTASTTPPRSSCRSSSRPSSADRLPTDDPSPPPPALPTD